MPDSQTIFIAIGSTGFLVLLLSVVLGEIGGHGEIGEHGGDFGGHGGELGGHGSDLSGHGGDLSGQAGEAGGHVGELGGHAGEVGGSMGDAGGHLDDVGGHGGDLSGQAGEVGGSTGDAGGHLSDVDGPSGDAVGHAGDAGGQPSDLGLTAASGAASGSDAGPAAQGVPEGSADLDAPTWRSIRVLAVSLVGFGAAGFIATSSGVPALLAWPVAAAGFLAVGAAAYRFILKPLAAQQYNSMTSRYGWIGRTGVVTLDILPYGTGQVTFHDRQGARITQTASSDLAEGIPKGSAVTITDLNPGGVVVHRSAFSD